MLPWVSWKRGLPASVTGTTRDMLLAMKADDASALQSAMENNDSLNEQFPLHKYTSVAGWGEHTFSSTLLFWACLHGKTKCAKMLVERGADVNIQMIAGGHNQQTAIMVAVKGLHFDIVELLLDRSDLSLCDVDGNTVLDLVREGMKPSTNGFNSEAIKISTFVLGYLQTRTNAPTMETDTKDSETEVSDSKTMFREWFELNFKARQWNGVYESFAANGLDDLMFWLNLNNDSRNPENDMFSYEHIFRTVLGLDKQIFVKFFCQQLRRLEMKYFLSCLSLAEYTETLSHWNFPNLESVINSEMEVNSELLSDIGIEKEGHRLRLLHAFDNAKRNLGRGANSSGYFSRPSFGGEGDENEVPRRLKRNSFSQGANSTSGSHIG